MFDDLGVVLRYPFSEEWSKRRAQYLDQLTKIEPAFWIWSEDKKTQWLSITDPACEKVIKNPSLHRTRLECELVLDFDNKDIGTNITRAKQAEEYLLTEWKIKSALWFSGNKGVHLHAFIPGATHQHMLGLFHRIRKLLKTKLDDGVMMAKRHMIRAEYSINHKTGFIKFPLSNEDATPQKTNLFGAELRELDFIEQANRTEKTNPTRWFSRQKSLR